MEILNAKKRIISLIVIAILLTGTFYTSEAKDKGPLETTCSECHGNIKDVLPDNHSAVEGDNITVCLACHTPSLPDHREPNPFSARLHRVHLQAGNETDCIVCHTFNPGNSFGLQGAEISYGSPERETVERIREVFISWSDSSFLDSIHSLKDITCSGCHGSHLFSGNKLSVADKCIGCHPGYTTTLEEISSNPPKEFDPHKSHHGNLDCTICHMSHEASVLFCLKCHGDLEIKIPGNPAIPSSK